MAFATKTEVAARLGRTLTDDEETQVDALLEHAAQAIAEVVDQDQDWIDELDPVPFALKSVSIEATVRVMLNPAGVRSQSEQLGSYQHSETFAGDAGNIGLVLTDDERRRVRRAINGTFTAATLASPYGDSTADEPPELPL